MFTKRMTLLATFSLIGCLSIVLKFSPLVQAQTQQEICRADLNKDGQVSLIDYTMLINQFFTNDELADLNNDGVVDLTDFSQLATSFLKTCQANLPTSTPTTTPSPTIVPSITSTPTPSIPGQVSNDWTQDAGNAQRTGYTSKDPGNSSNWQFAWSWNGPDKDGGTGDHFYDAGRSDSRSIIWEGRTVTGGDFVYVPALTNGLYALRKSNGSIAWNAKVATFRATPAYDPSTQTVLVGGTNGILYKIQASNGNVLGSYNAGSPLNESMLIVGGHVFAMAENGELHKVSIQNMSRVWTYSAGTPSEHAPAYSASADAIIFATKDLYVHAVNNNNGQRKWRVKPTSLQASDANTFEAYWPTVADEHGVVFVRMNISNAGLWSGPGQGNKYPETNTAIRNHLNQNPHLKNLFALDVHTGAEKFVPAVGPGGVEALRNNNFFIVSGPLPVVKKIPNGPEIAYSHFRNGQTRESYYDGRWDSHIGEMVLDNSTVSGYSAGDLRFVRFDRSQVHITDEQSPLTMAGNTLFHAHWGASESITIQDRSASRGSTFANPITSVSNPAVIRRMQACGTKNAQTHWTTCGLTLFDDGRYWNGPGWWVYWNVLDPPTPHRGAYSEGVLPRYTYVSGDLIIVQGNGGELFVLRHGNGQ